MTTGMDITQINLPFRDFLAHLHRQGFIIGVDHHLRLQALLNKLGKKCKPTDLKFLLCPIFATSEKQQKQFYRAFDSYFKPLEAGITGKPTPRDAKKTKAVESPEEPVKTRKWQYILLGVLLSILVGLLSNLLVPPQKPPIKRETAIKTEKTTVPTTPRAKKQAEDPTTTPVSVKASFEAAQTWAKEIERMNEPTYEPTFYQRYEHIFQWVGLVAPFIIFLLLWSYKYNRQRPVLLKQRGKKPPFVWPIKVETPEKMVVKNEQFYQAARLLRQRLKSDVRRIDVDKTISSTIEQAGFPTFRYKAMTRPPEYLILIDLPAYRDHYAHLIDSIAKALENEGLFVKRYFYKKDPRVCFKEPDGEGVYLSDFKTLYSDHRLIVFGDGDALLDPFSGGLDKWIGLFHSWRERAVLTPVQPKNWSMREVAIAQEFIVLPASLDGLGALKAHFENVSESDLKSRKQADSKAVTPPQGYENDADGLQAYLGEDTFQWLCACAVYPELHWDLTLYLGALSCMPENLICEENLLRLIRLPWFRIGSMPDELRWELISKLDPEKSRVIRAAIVDLLEKNPAPKESFAYENYRLHLVVQRWMLSGKRRKRRKEMLKSLRTVREKQILQDYTLLRFLESTPRSPLSFVLPKRLKKIFYRKGVPLFGLRTGIRLVLTVLIASAFFLVLKAPPPKIPIPINLTFKHPGTVKGATFSPDGTKILTWSDDNTTRLWDLEGNAILVFTGHVGSVTSAAFSPDGKTILTGSQDKTARLWDLEGNAIQVFKGHVGSVTSVAFSPDGTRILTASWDKTARLWDLEGNAIQVFKGHVGSVTSVAFSPDGKTILTGSWDKTARLWDRQGNLVMEFKWHTGFISSVAFSPNGITILTSSEDKTARLWDLSGLALQRFEHKGTVLGVTFNADGTMFLTWSSDGTARLWNAKEESPEVRPIKHDAKVYGATFSKDDRAILTCSADGTAKFISIDSFMIDPKYSIPKYPELVPLEGGNFLMGADPFDTNSTPSETPQHSVTIMPFAIGRYEVTNAQFVEFLNEKGNREEGDGLWLRIEPGLTKIKSTSQGKYVVEGGYENYPVVGVSWYGSRAYCQWLKETTDIPFRLPTEAEWEYACRAEIRKAFNWNEESKDYEKYGWFDSNSDYGPHEVGQKLPNDFGLYDMHGNMWEWCLDGWTPNYKNADRYGRAVPPVGNEPRVARGGSWKNPLNDARPSNRLQIEPVPGYDIMGFRVVVSLEKGYIDKENLESPRPAITGATQIALAGDLICICGYFPDGNSRNGLLLDGKHMGRPVSSSSHVVVYRLPSDIQHGVHRITGDTAAGFGASGVQEIEVIRFRSSIGPNTLRPGESALLRLWIEGTEKMISLTLSNKTPGIASMEGGNEQELSTSGGTYNTIVKTVVGVSPGEFHIIPKLDTTCPCNELVNLENFRARNLGTGKELTITSPNGGENWVVGSIHDITWTSIGGIGNVKLEYSTDGGKTWTLLDAVAKNDGSRSWKLPNVSSSKCKIRISEKDGSATDTSDGVFTILGQMADPNWMKPNLYVVSIGISDYEKPGISLDYADDDARAISRLFATQKGRLFKNVYIKPCYSKTATRDNIINALEWLDWKATQEDVAVVFVAAHGFIHRGKCYILPHGGDPNRLRSTAVSWDVFVDILGNLPSRILFFLDICHSGGIDPDLLEKYRGRSPIDNTEAIRELASEENGVVVMAASTGKELSIERSEWGHGAFTKAIIEGLEGGKADYSRDGIIHIRELDHYISERVKELTRGKQHPTTQHPTSISRFPIFQLSARLKALE